jgi:glycosyltransferase involved in cell wall biosynthesis
MTERTAMRIVRLATIPFFLLHHLRSQIDALVDAGHEVVLISSPIEGADALERIARVRFVPIDIPREIAPLRDLAALVSIYRRFRSFRPDVVHSTTPKAGLLCALAAFLAHVEVRLHTFTGQQWTELSGPVRWFSMASDWLIARLNTHCYADSPSQRDFLVTAGLCRADAISVLESGSLAGVDLARFDSESLAESARRCRETLSIPHAARVVLFIGRVTRDKGLVELADAFSRVKALDPEAYLVVVGPTEPKRDPLPPALLRALESDARIRMTGYDPEPEKYIAMADLLCLPSYREGFPNVVLEAGALGVPTIGTRINGLRDAVDNGVTGLLVPPKNAAALAEALACLLEDETKRKQMGNAARERARSLFDSRVVNARVLEEYKRLLKNRNPTG